MRKISLYGAIPDYWLNLNRQLLIFTIL